MKQKQTTFTGLWVMVGATITAALLMFLVASLAPRVTEQSNCMKYHLPEDCYGK